jgi:hypothetical protein
MVAPTCFGITLTSSGSVPSAFWEMLNWAVDRVLWMGVLCLVAWVATSYLRPITPGKRELPVPLGGHQSPSGKFWALSVDAIEFRTPDHPAPSHMTTRFCTVPARQCNCYYLHCKVANLALLIGRILTSNCLLRCDDVWTACGCAQDIRGVCHMRGGTYAVPATVARTCCDVIVTSSYTAWVRVCKISVLLRGAILLLYIIEWVYTPHRTQLTL